MSTTIFRCDGSAAIGTGHVMRCLALAQSVHHLGNNVLFVMREDGGIEERVKREGFDVVCIQGKNDLQETALLAREHGADWVVVDGYQFDSFYQEGIKNAGFKLLFIDDYGHCDHYHADIVLNQNVYASNDLYGWREPYTRLLLGAKYVLLRKEFRSFETPRQCHGEGFCPSTALRTGSTKLSRTITGVAPQDDTFQHILLTLGGFAQPERSSNIQRGLENAGYAVSVTSGDADVPHLMQWADIAVSAGGTTVYELAYMGIPSVLLVRADNQQAVAEGMTKAGCAVNLGRVEDVKIEEIIQKVDALLNNTDQRRRMSEAGHKLIDGKGANRVLDAMRAYSPVLK